MKICLKSKRSDSKAWCLFGGDYVVRLDQAMPLTTVRDNMLSAIGCNPVAELAEPSSSLLGWI